MAYNPNLPAGQATMANSSPVVLASNQTAIPVTDNGGSITVDGTVTANAGTNLNTSALALSATQTDKSQFTKLTDGTDTALITASGEQNVLATAQPGVDIGDVTVNNGSGASAVNIQDGGNTITVDGAVTITTTDIAPATQNITVVDSASSTATGANNQSLVTGTPTVGSAASFSVSSIETIRVEVTGTWTGTLTAESSIDGGTTWTAQGLHQGAYTTASFTANLIGGANIAGATNFRMRATATITGTAVVKVVESINTQSVYIANAAPSGTVISVLNSSTATLTSGSVFTGTGEDVTNFSEMRVSVFSNVASASDGISLQQSTDNTNWDITDVYTIAAATGKTFVVPRQARYFRIVYTNGGTNQASFRLQTILNRTATAPSSNRAADAYSNETDLVQNQVFPMGYNGATWDRLRTVGTGVLKTDTSSVAGTATSVNNGTTDAGTTRVTLSSDSTGQVKLATGANTIGALTANQSVNVAQINGVTTLMGNGVTGTGSQRVTIASDNTAFSVNPVSATVPVSTMNSASANNGVNSALAAVFDDTSPTAITENSFGFVRMSANRNQYTTTRDAAGNERGQNVNANNAAMIAIDQTTVGTTNAVTTVPATSGGLSVYHLASAASTNLQVPKASAGQLYGYMVSNTSAAYSYLCFHNSASTPTAGASIFFKIGIPAGGAANVNFDNGIAFSSGIAISTVTGAADNNTTAVALNDQIINLFYK